MSPGIIVAAGQPHDFGKILRCNLPLVLSAGGLVASGAFRGSRVHLLWLASCSYGIGWATDMHVSGNEAWFAGSRR